MPILPLVIFGVFAVLMVLVYGLMLSPPNKLVEKLNDKKKAEPDAKEK